MKKLTDNLLVIGIIGTTYFGLEFYNSSKKIEQLQDSYISLKNEYDSLKTKYDSLDVRCNYLIKGHVNCQGDKTKNLR